MKKILVMVLMFVTMFTLVGCMSEDDYYDRALIDAQVAGLNLQIDELRTQLAEMQPTQIERYVSFVINGMFMGESYQFAEVGDTVVVNVPSWDYGYIILELTEETTIDIVINDAAADGEWDLNVYFTSDLYEPGYTFEYIYRNDSFRVTLPAGFITIEFDSYADIDYQFNVTINPVT
jgi:hypothetical protein